MRKYTIITAYVDYLTIFSGSYMYMNAILENNGKHQFKVNLKNA